MDNIDQILNGQGYFDCERNHARVSKEVCIKRQKKNKTPGTYGYLYPDCIKCEQGRENMMSKKIEETNIINTHKVAVLSVLSSHIGREKAIDMGDLYSQVFGKDYSNKISDTRGLRSVITLLRKDGVPICSTTSKNGGGYYLAGAGSELEDYLSRIRRRALKALWMESKIRKIGLAELLGQMQMNLGSR
ncbi:MAG: hypothetical protein ABIJ37_03195 [Pseudomonadota bacterium]